MKLLKGTNQFQNKYGLRPDTKRTIAYLLFLMLVIAIVGFFAQVDFKKEQQRNNIKSPLGWKPEVFAEEIQVFTLTENQDTWIGQYAEKYATKSKNASYLRYQLHCLANKENGHHANDKCGDNGKSCGMYQYREGTWNGFRKEMIKKGLASEVGSLWDDQQAIETTAWALANGKENHWGPIVNKGACL